MADSFTNRDARLIPRKIDVHDGPGHGPREYPVSPETFPQLHAAFTQLQDAAGLNGYGLVILSDFGGAGADWHRQIIGIGIRKINALSFAEVKATIGHELGHLYLRDHQGVPYVGKVDPSLSDKRREEVEADRLGACLMGEKESTIGALRHGGVSMDPDLSVEFRAHATLSFNLATCPTKSRGQKSKG